MATSVLIQSSLKEQIEKHRESDLLTRLQTWSDERQPDGTTYNRAYLSGKNSWFFQDSKPYYYVLLEDGWSELVRGRTRVDALSQALQVIEAMKPRIPR